VFAEIFVNRRKWFLRIQYFLHTLMNGLLEWEILKRNIYLLNRGSDQVRATTVGMTIVLFSESKHI